MKFIIKNIFRKIFISKKKIVMDEWKISPLSKLNLKFLAIQHFIDTTPTQSDILELGVGGGYSI